jgi:predicted DNA binding protein
VLPTGVVVTTRATLHVPTEAVGLTRLLGDGDAEARLLRSVSLPGAEPMSAAVVRGGDPAWLEQRLTEDDSVASPARLTANGDSALFRLSFQGLDDELSRLLTARDISVLDAQSVGGEWAFELITDDRSALGDVTQGWDAAGFDHRVERVVTVDDLKEASQYGLTDTQADTLITAHRAGYYEVPRTDSEV